MAPVFDGARESTISIHYNRRKKIMYGDKEIITHVSRELSFFITDERKELIFKMSEIYWKIKELEREIRYAKR